MATERSAGAGGKFRKKPSRSTQSTPYDRPASALRPIAQLRQNNINNNNGWLSKLVDPASRLITAGANKLFSSVFRKRLLPPPQHPPPDDTMEKGDVQPENTTQVAPFGTKEPVVCRGDDSRVSDNGGVAELEDILKQKTFTRSEIDHLSALLLSRTAENSVGTQTASLEPKTLGEMAVHSRHQTTPSNLPALENGAGHVLPAAVLTPDVRSKAVEDAVASPAELAKAYMGSRPTRASPSVAAMQNEMQREDLSQYNPFVKQKTPAMSVIQKPVNNIGASANGFMTPRFRGRSAIYSMARTPYSRPEPAEVYKAADTASVAHGAPSSAHNATETQQFSVSKRQVLKRRSSVLESDIGFVGPIRRIRQKPNLLNHKTLSLPASGGSYVKHGYGDLADVNEVPSSSGRSSNYCLSSKALAYNGMASTSNGYVPSQSIEMAQKIFQQLDKFSPKGKSPENNVDIAEGSSSGKMMSDTRDGLAHRSMNTVYSSKVLQTVQDSKKENGLSGSISARDHTSKISPRVEEGCAKKFVTPPVDDGTKAGCQNKVLDLVNPQPNFDHQHKKRAFQMSAHEDYLELDDDVLTNGAASTPVIEGVESHEVAKDTAALSGTPPQNASISGWSPVSEPKPSALLFGTSEEEAVPDGSAAAQKVSGFAFPAVPSISSATRTSTQAGASSAKSTAETVKVAERSENTNVVPAFSAKMAPFTFSSTLSTVESAAANDIKQELPSSAMEAAAKADGPGKFDKKSTLLFGDASKKMADGPNEASSTKGFFSFGLPSNGATVSNGLSNTVSVTMGVSFPVQISSSTNYPSPVPVSVTSPSLFSFSNGNAVSFSSSAAPAGTVITTVTSGSSSSQSSTSMTAPSVSFGSSFQFGSSTSATAVTSASMSAASGAKSNQFAFGNATSSLFSAKPSGTASTGNNISGLDSTFVTASTETQTAASAVANGPMFGLQASSSAVAISTSMPSFSSQSTLSASSHAFGLNAPSSFNASTSVFGLSSTVANPFTSGSTSALNASGSSSMSEPVSSSSNTSSIFGWQSSKPTAPGSVFGTSFQSTGFSVGSTASGHSAAGNSTPIVFGATSSSSAASSKSSPFVFGSGPPASSVFSVSSSAPSSTPFPSQPAFGCSTPQAFTFVSTPAAGNNDRMSMEDSMAEDSVQVSTPAATVFGVPNSAPSSGFAFGAAAPSAGNPFQFGGQPNQIVPQNTPFQPSGSLEFNAGGGGGGGAGSFSLGSGGGDKANRRYVKVKKGVRRK